MSNTFVVTDRLEGVNHIVGEFLRRVIDTRIESRF